MRSRIASAPGEFLGGEIFERSDVLHRTHVTVGIGLRVVPASLLGVPEVRSAVVGGQFPKARNLEQPRRRLSQAHPGRQSGDPLAVRRRVVLGEEVDHPHPPQDLAILPMQGITAVSRQVPGVAVGQKGAGEASLPPDADADTGLHLAIRGLEVHVHQGRIGALGVLQIDAAELPRPQVEVRARGVAGQRGQFERAALTEVGKVDALAQPRAKDLVCRVPGLGASGHDARRYRWLRTETRREKAHSPGESRSTLRYPSPMSASSGYEATP